MCQTGKARERTTGGGQTPAPASAEVNASLAFQEAIAYFQAHPGFHRLFCALKEKYRSLGALGGQVRLTDLTPEERAAFTGFLRKDFSGEAGVTLKVADLAAALEKTKFHQFNLEEILQGYWGEELCSKKEERLRAQEEREGFFASIRQELPPAAAAWLQETLEQKANAYKILVGRYEQDREALSRDLKVVGQALAELPGRAGTGTQLALFASQLTTDPHYFDQNRPARQLLLYALSHYFQVEKPNGAFAEAELLYQAGLYNPEITNYTICLGLLGRQKGADLHPGWAGFYREGETLQLSLENLSRIEQVVSPTGVVYVVENPAVFSALADRWRREKGQAAVLSLVCANGQINLATLVLLEKVVASGAVLYYSGDFDPEGLLIADRLKARFGEALHLWRYLPEDYAKTVSGRKISPGRLKQLERLKDETLGQVGRALVKKGYAGYQELLIDDLWRDLKEFMEHCL
ncbi:MAG TPA: TIGR02679 family protein [Bacillota bacterium]|jgi:uncharacterized protein (TIGR02679 family)